MWVQRDDGALACVAQCRPEHRADGPALRRRGHLRGRLGATPDRGVPVRGIKREEDPHTRLGLRRADLKVEAVPVRYDAAVVAVLTHQTALASTANPHPLERAYLDCAGDPAHDLRGAGSQRRRPGDVAVQPPRRRRFHPPRRERRHRLASPERAVGPSPDGADVRASGAQPRRHHPPADLGPVRGPELAGHVRDPLSGGSSMRFEGGRLAARRCCCARRWWCTAGGWRGGAHPRCH